jgi:PEP-CTERM motif
VEKTGITRNIFSLNYDKKINTLGQLLIPAVAISVLSAIPAQAAIFNATFTSTADNSQYGNPYVDNVNAGDLFKVIIALDNGGSSLLNQTWTAANIVNVTFDFGNGAHTTVFNPNGGNGLNGSTGNFTTDATGQLTAVPLDWGDFSQVNVVSTNSSQTPTSWYLNQYNDLYFTNNDSFSVGIPNPGDNLVAANWTITAAPPVTSVPEPGTILGLLTVGSLGFLKRKQ